MKKTLTLFLLFAALLVRASTYRNYVGHFLSGTTYTVYVNSDTAFGEDVIGQICYTPGGGGATQYTGWQIGSYDDTSVPGANWKVIITIPAGATSPLLELANENESNQQYGWTGCNIALNNVLPVELTRFEAELSGNTVVLRWATDSEKDNAMFVIERAANGNLFESIGELKGAGTSQHRNQYRFEDDMPQNGMNYYRLKTVEFSGEQAYSSLIPVVFSKNATSLYTFPNPVKNDMQVLFTQQNADVYNIEIIDFYGKRHFAQNGEGHEGDNEVGFETALLPCGIYFIRVNEQTTRFVKM